MNDEVSNGQKYKLKTNKYSEKWQIGTSLWEWAAMGGKGDENMAVKKCMAN